MPIDDGPSYVDSTTPRSRRTISALDETEDDSVISTPSRRGRRSRVVPARPAPTVPQEVLDLRRRVEELSAALGRVRTTVGSANSTALKRDLGRILGSLDLNPPGSSAS